MCVNKLLHSNFIWGPFLITLEGLTLITMESVKFRDILDRKQPKNTKVGVNLSSTGGALKKLNPEHSRMGGEFINYEVCLGILLKKPLGGNHLHFVKKWHLGHPGLP